MKFFPYLGWSIIGYIAGLILSILCIAILYGLKILICKDCGKILDVVIIVLGYFAYTYGTYLVFKDKFINITND